MKELFIITSSNYRRPVPRKFKEKNDGPFQGQQNKIHQMLAMLLARKIVSMKILYEEHSSKTFAKNFY